MKLSETSVFFPKVHGLLFLIPLLIPLEIRAYPSIENRNIFSAESAGLLLKSVKHFAEQSCAMDSICGTIFLEKLRQGKVSIRSSKTSPGVRFEPSTFGLVLRRSSN